MQEKETVYLAGKITGDPEYRAKFERAQRKLENSGFIVINPAGLPSEGFAYEAYMRMSGAMLAECDAVCFLPDWMDSKGAIAEYQTAIKTGKRIFMFEVWRNRQDQHGAPLICRIQARLFGQSPSAMLGKCTIGRQQSRKQCADCDCNVRELMENGFTAGLYERRAKNAKR